VVLNAVPGGFPRVPAPVHVRPRIARTRFVQRALDGRLLEAEVAPAPCWRSAPAVPRADDRRLLSSGLESLLPANARTGHQPNPGLRIVRART